MGNASTVCLMANAVSGGGAERCVLELADSLNRHPEDGYRPWVLVPHPDGPLVRALREARVDYEVIPLPAGFARMGGQRPCRSLVAGLSSLPGLVSYFRRVAEAVRRRRTRLLHANGMKPFLLSALLGRALDVPVLWQLHSMYPPRELRLLRAICRLFPVELVAVSRAAARHFDGAAAIPVVHNGIDVEHYRREPHRHFHGALGLAPSDPVIGIVGVLRPGKGQLQFLQMAHRILQRRRAGFVIIGDEVYDTLGHGTFRAQLRREVERLGMAGAVSFAGFREDAPEAYAGLDVSVHATFDQEAFGRVLIESMSCKVPLVATALDGVVEVVEHERTGLLVPPLDVPAMAAAVERLLDEPLMRKRLGEEGRRAVETRFSLDRHRVAMARRYGDVIGRPPPAFAPGPAQQASVQR
jgi:glycosyltransferase involved in cell wall biosynthesis